MVPIRLFDVIWGVCKGSRLQVWATLSQAWLSRILLGVGPRGVGPRGGGTGETQGGLGVTYPL